MHTCTMKGAKDFEDNVNNFVYHTLHSSLLPQLSVFHVPSQSLQTSLRTGAF